ncbi:MAG: CRISPR-associated endonuclease Cas1 [Spirochaetales bacterium]|nr:CRISPR-associated endonuclease Cas1 [Spirochaetales bacterium]
MDLYINTFGTYLRKSQDMFELEKDGQKTRVSPKKVRSIIIGTSVFLTTDAVKLAVENNIDILMTDDFGNPYGRFWHSRFGSTAFIRRRQLEIFDTEEGLELAKNWIKNKINSSIDHLKELEYKRYSKSAIIEEKIGEIAKFIQKLDEVSGTLEEKRNTIMAYEGNAARHYYEILSYLIPEPFRFEGRSYRPAKDEFNCLLNYAFGVLYGKVEKACIIAGLDPFVGILHVDNYNKKSLVFDLIENFRHLAWRTVFSMFSRKKINKSYFDSIRNGIKLNQDGKKALLEDFTERLNKKVLYRNRKISNLDIIQFECHNVANYLIGKKES